MAFEWDEEKRDRNLVKHGVDFVRAAKIFDNPVLELRDTREDYGEERWIAVGHWQGYFLVVVYTWRDGNRRIISAWKLTPMKKKHITKASLNEVMTMKDRTRSNAPVGPSLGKDFWKDAKVVYPETSKEQVTVRFDADMLQWFKERGRGYQTRMNAVLRSYYEAHKNETLSKR